MRNYLNYNHNLSIFSEYLGKQSRIAKYYKNQEKLLKDFSDMESIHELGCLAGAPTEVIHIHFFFQILVSMLGSYHSKNEKKKI